MSDLILRRRVMLAQAMAGAKSCVLYGTVTVAEATQSIAIPELESKPWNRLIFKVKGDLSNGLNSGYKVTVFLFLDTTDANNCASIGSNNAGTVLSAPSSSAANITYSNGKLLYTAGSIYFAPAEYEFYAWEE